MKQVLPALLALFTVQSLVCLAGAVAPVLAPVAALDLGMDPRLVGVLVAITFGIAAFSSLASGPVVARFGAMRTSQATLLASAVGLIGLVIGTPLTLLIASALLGIAYGPSQPAASLLLLRLTPQHLTNVVFSIRQTGVPIGLALAGGVLPLLTLWLGWQGATLATAATIVVVAVLLEPLRRRLDGEEISARGFSFAQLVHPLRLVWNTPPLSRLVLMSFFYSMMQTSLGTFLVIYLNERLGFSLVVAGLVLTVTQVTAAICRILWGIVADRWISPWRLLGLIGIGTSISAWLLASFTQEWPLAAIVLVSALFGATAVAWNGLFVAQMARLAPAGHVSQVAGAGGFAAFTGVTVGPALFTLMLAVTNSYAVPFVMLSLFTLAVGLWLVLSDHRKMAA
jgi:MFS family permease